MKLKQIAQYWVLSSMLAINSTHWEDKQNKFSYVSDKKKTEQVLKWNCPWNIGQNIACQIKEINEKLKEVYEWNNPDENLIKQTIDSETKAIHLWATWLKFSRKNNQNFMSNKEVYEWISNFKLLQAEILENKGVIPDNEGLIEANYKNVLLYMSLHFDNLIQKAEDFKANQWNINKQKEYIGYIKKIIKLIEKYRNADLDYPWITVSLIM